MVRQQEHRHYITLVVGAHQCKGSNFTPLLLLWTVKNCEIPNLISVLFMPGRFLIPITFSGIEIIPNF